jgi:DNA primase
MQYKNMTFKEAIHYLKEKYCPDMKGSAPQSSTISIDHSKLNQVFMDSLHAEKNLKKFIMMRGDLKNRHLHAEEVMKKYRLGYVKKGVLSWMLQKKLTTTSELEELGFLTNDVLIGEDRFSIPIIRNDKIIGFSLRRTDEVSIKYINLINKKIKYNDILFNIDSVQNEVTVCEGVFDAIRLTEEGFPAVAMFGTKFNSDLFKRYNRVTLFYDGDGAGIKAGIEAFFSGFKKIKVLYSANNAHDRDPCELDSVSLQYCMNTARPTFEYVIEKSFKHGIKSHVMAYFFLQSKGG